MALTRKMLKAMSIEDEKIDEIISAHTEVTDALKNERDGYKADAEKLDGVQRLYDDLKKKVDENKDDGYKEKYEKEHKDFEAYKADVEAEKTKVKKANAYKSLLKEAGVSEKRYDAIIRLTDFDKVELDEDGGIKNSEDTVKAIKEEWSDYIVTEGTKGADTPTPPDTNNGAGAKTPSRAAMIVAKHNERLYGVKGDQNK